jgi:uracil-DNA glycosylase
MGSTSEFSSLVADLRERVKFLGEIGLEGLDAKMSEAPAVKERPVARPVEASKFAAAPPPVATSTPVIKKDNEPRRSLLGELPSLSKILPPTEPKKEIVQTSQTSSIEVPTGIETLPEPIETIEQIRTEIGPDCRRCKLCDLGRTRVVNSVGNFNADLMFVGEAPGADEDAKGEPFVGRAGQLLTDIIEKGLGVNREDVFIGNINRCRPPGNRAPEPDETLVCKPFLWREIAVVRPKVIVVLGATAAHNLLQTKVPISKMRGHFHDAFGVKVMPTFHPAYLLRDPHKKREVWEDIKLVKEYLRRK